MSVQAAEENVLNIAYLGPAASFSNQAASDLFRPFTSTSSRTSSTFVLHPLPSFASIFASLQSPSSTASGHGPTVAFDYAVVPFENSTNGSVVQVLDLLSQCGLNSDALYPDLEVCAEYYLPVHHCLFISPPTEGVTENAALTDRLSSIRTIYSHPQVWGQCDRFLTRHFSANVVERIDVGSTSAAAQIVAHEHNGGHSAAISAKLAGEKHELLLLAENIEDHPGSNTTRFFVLRNRTRRRKRDEFDEWLRRRELQRDRAFKSIVMFTIPHTKPGSLADTLAVFKQHSLNLTSIDTRPSRKRNWQYIFFVECEENMAESSDERKISQTSKTPGNLTGMLEELANFTENLSYLGRFEDQLPKKKDV